VALLWVGVGALGFIRWAGGMTDRFGRRMVAGSVAALGVSGLLPVFAHGVLALSFGLLVVGAAPGAVDAAINAAASRAEAGRRSVLTLAHGVFSLAVVAGSLGVASAAGRDGRAWALVVMAGVLFVVAAVSTRLSFAPGVGDRTPGVPRPWRGRPSTALRVLGGCAALAYFVENAWQSWGAIQLHSTLGASLRVAALAPAVFGAAAAVGRFAGHLLSAAVPPAAMVAVGAATAAGGSLLGALAPSTAPALLGMAIAGLGTSVCAPTIIALAGRTSAHAQGAATGTVITIAYLGFVVGPAAVGLLSGATTLATALVGVAMLAALLVVAGPAATRTAERV